MTSLATQLQRLALPQSELAVPDKDRERASLLFDPKEAANLDRDTFYALGVNGLDELANIDPVFLDFHNNLFSQSSKNLERVVQTKEVNARLDENISRFLTLVSPYFLLRPAQKALEWLINRFHIHRFNTDDLVACVLPYHQTKMFVRVVQLLKIEQPTNRWNWMAAIQKPGTPLARSTVINHCAADLGFLTFICDMVQKATKLHSSQDSSAPSPMRALVSFYATTILGALEVTETIKENMVTKLLPYVLKGLKSRAILDYKAASYVIIGQLANKITMQGLLVQTFVKGICKHISPQLSLEAVTCLAVLCHKQRVDKLPKRSFKLLCRVPGLVQTLARLTTAHEITGLLTVFLPQLVKAAVNDTVSTTTGTSSEGEDGTTGPVSYCGLLENLLLDVELPESLQTLVAKTLFQDYLTVRSQMTGKSPSAVQSLNERAGPIVKLIDRRYPVAMDTILQIHMGQSAEEVSEVSHDAEHVQEFVSLSLAGLKHQLVPEAQTSLVLSLNHPNATVRRNAVKHLPKAWQRQQGEADLQFVKDALIQRLGDDDDDVVMAALDVLKDLPTLPKEGLEDSLIPLLHRSDVSESAADVLTSEVLLRDNPTVHDKVAVAVLPLMFVVVPDAKSAEVTTAAMLARSYLCQEHPLLKGAQQAWSHLSQSSDVNVVMATANQGLVSHLSGNLAAMEPDMRQSMVQKLYEAATSPAAVCGNLPMVVSFILANLIRQLDPGDQGALCQQALDLVCNRLHQVGSSEDGKPLRRVKGAQDLQNLKFLHTKVAIMPQNLTIHYQKMSHQGLGPDSPQFVPVLLWLLNNIIVNLHVPADLTSKQWWSQQTADPSQKSYLSLLVQLFDLLVTFTSGAKADHHVQHFRQLMQNFLKVHLPDTASLFRFLSMLWVCHHDDSHTRALVQVRALHMAAVCINSSGDKAASKLMGKESGVLPSLLVTLQHRVPAVREAAVAVLEALLKQSDGSMYGEVLVKKLVHAREELVADNNHLKQALHVLFKPLEQPKLPVSKASPGKHKQKAEAKQAVLQATLDSLLGHVTAEDTPPHMKVGLLEALQLVNSQGVLCSLLPMLGALLEKCPHGLTPEEAAILHHILVRYQVPTAPLLQPSHQALQLFQKAMGICGKPCDGQESPQTMALRQITKEFFSSLPSPAVRQALLSTLFDLQVIAPNPQIAKEISHVLKVISLQAEEVAIELKKFTQSAPSTSVRGAKKMRRATLQAKVTQRSATDSEPWRRVTVILEMLQNKKKVRSLQLIVPPLFAILARCLEEEEQTPVEYLKQLVLTCLLNTCERLSPDNNPLPPDVLPEEQFNAELIVQCIQLSDSPQTHNQALLLLGTAAGLFPDKVLHQAMAIFTFMGAHVLRQDDTYSLQIITRTVDTVIPALIQASERNPSLTVANQKLDSIVAMVIRVFVDALPHIPEHRRQAVFHHLVRTVGGGQYLWTTLALVFESKVVGKTGGGVHSDGEDKVLGSDAEFCVELCSHFPPDIQVLSLVQLLKYISSLPEDKEDRKGPSPAKRPRRNEPVSSEKRSEPLFDVANHTAHQLRNFKFLAVSFFPVLLGNSLFVGQLVDLEMEASDKMRGLYQSLLEETLQYIRQVALSLDKNSTNPTARFWRALLHKAYDTLEKVNALLPTEVFIGVVSGLMQNNMATVRKKAMELLNSKLQQPGQQWAQGEVALLLDMLQELQSVAMASKDDTPTAEELAVNRQTALYSLKLLCRALGTAHPDSFVEVLKGVTKIMDNTEKNPLVVSAALLCLAELCSCLKAHAIPHLPAFMPPLLNICQSTQLNKSQELLLLSALTAAHKVCENLPHFLSPYLLPLLLQVTRLSHLMSEAEEFAQKSHITARLKAIRHCLASTIAPRILIPAVAQCYNELEKDTQGGIGPLMSVLSERITTMSKDDVTAHQSQTVSFFITALNYRAKHAQDDFEDVQQVEGHVMEAVLSLVMKLSEVTFRPMFFKLYDWASRPDSSRQRLLTFYRLAEAMADRLKSLFVLFAGHIVKNAASTLDSNNVYKTEETYFGDSDADQKKSSLLLGYILDCLYKVFLYDNENFVNKETFDLLMQPLVDQIENLQGGEEVFTARVENHVVPCIAQFAVAVGDDASWKPLHYQIMLKTRHDSPKVRFAALQVLEEFQKKLGESFMVLLPETIPFLAELMEDECEEVEDQCQKVISEMETTLGEDLQKYF
ncbi:PREDICTED: HEAT repeat-containing protein 1-like [Branchiostoma belcheri]|uniref:HEAT repeat-containing protein 1 n=1 Tax=Branchiostoma belcheri TaxID=7741 RepID=A0A6P4YSM0_BRABE|nr:PREDICTED: HEAT repeat-containing protein 1-like [Branchiostoma belcheri]